MENFVCLFTSRKWFLMRRMPVPKAAPTLSHQKKAYSFIVQKQHVSTGLSLRPKENVPAFFLAEKSIFLKTHTRAHAHTHTHTHISLPLPKFISPEKPRSFSGILGSQEIMETVAHWEGSRALCHTHTRTESHGDSQQEEHCVCFHAPLLPSLYTYMHTHLHSGRNVPPTH